MASDGEGGQVRRVLILGGGFAGVNVAQQLEKRLKHVPNVEIAIVNQENYFVFQPLLAEVVSGNIGLLDTVNPIRRMLKRARLYVREIDNINLDVMYGLPGQDVAGAEADLQAAIALGPDHISWYHLTLEPNTIFHARPPA